MRHSPYHAITAIILASGAAVSIVLISVSELVEPGRVTGEEATLLSTVLGAIVGAAATYLGARHDDNPTGSPGPRSHPGAR